MGELDAEYDIKSLVDGDEVTFVTNGPSLVVKRLHAVTKAARDLSNTDLKGETHLYGRGAVNVDAGGGRGLPNASFLLKLQLRPAPKMPRKKMATWTLMSGTID